MILGHFGPCPQGVISGCNTTTLRLHVKQISCKGKRKVNIFEIATSLSRSFVPCFFQFASPNPSHSQYALRPLAFFANCPKPSHRLLRVSYDSMMHPTLSVNSSIDRHGSPSCGSLTATSEPATSPATSPVASENAGVSQCEATKNSWPRTSCEPSELSVCFVYSAALSESDKLISGIWPWVKIPVASFSRSPL